PESRQRDAEDREDRGTRNRKQCHHAKADDAGPDGDLPALVATHATCRGKENRGQARWVDSHQDGDERIKNTVEIRHLRPSAQAGYRQKPACSTLASPCQDGYCAVRASSVAGATVSHDGLVPLSF